MRTLGYQVVDMIGAFLEAQRTQMRTATGGDGGSEWVPPVSVPYVIINRGATEHDTHPAVSLRIDSDVLDVLRARFAQAGRLEWIGLHPERGRIECVTAPSLLESVDFWAIIAQHRWVASGRSHSFSSST